MMLKRKNRKNSWIKWKKCNSSYQSSLPPSDLSEEVSAFYTGKKTKHSSRKKSKKHPSTTNCNKPTLGNHSTNRNIPNANVNPKKKNSSTKNETNSKNNSTKHGSESNNYAGITAPSTVAKNVYRRTGSTTKETKYTPTSTTHKQATLRQRCK